MNTAKPSPLPYRGPPSAREQELNSYMYGVQPMRDRIAPIALLIVGYLLYLSFYITRYHVGLSGASAVSVAFAVIVAVEAAALIGLAYFAAGMFDIGFGRLGTAALKFAGAAAFCDGLAQHILWRFPSGGSPRGVMGRGSGGTFLVSFIFFIMFFTYLFELKLQDVGGFVALIGIGYLLFRFILLLNVARLTIVVNGVPITLVGRPTPAWMVTRRPVARPPPAQPAAPPPPPASPSAPGSSGNGG
jgi:hypothetical protein